VGVRVVPVVPAAPAVVAVPSEMDIARPEFVPDPALARDEMEALQREIAAAALFNDDLDFDPAAFENASPLVAGVDQAFVDDLAVSAIVLLRDGEVVERAHAAVETEIPYIPGLLSFREGGAILAAFEQLNRDPDLALFDGSGRIHYREAGLATHIGCTLDLPAIGVAKRLLCGDPEAPLDEKRPAGARVPILADDSVETATPGTTIGYAVQTRQFATAGRHVNPVYVSPGHRVSATTAADLVDGTCAGYKLPEPTRQADAYADEVKAEYAE